MAHDMSNPETHRFQAEVNQLLHLVINSLYSHKEIFLRELVSNASDALDKLKFRAITEPSLLENEPALEIRIVPDAAKNTLTIEDTGIGMTHDELVQNLGTIAHSGSRQFLEQMAQRGQKDVNLIGQFGVGFYSAYLVADTVEVVSRAAGSNDAYRWTSAARDTFTVEPAQRAERGTSVILHLKEDQKDFLQEWRLRELIQKYSDFVSHPIKLLVTKRTGEGENEKTETKLEAVNRANAVWQRPKSEITEEQYNDFYKHLTHDFDPPLARTHFRVEGSQEFVGLLFVPRHQPFDINIHRERRGIRLFVKRVFIMDNCEELLPQWLRFVRGVIDSDDLPLNVSREILQDSAVVRSIRKQVVKRTLDLLDEVAKDRKDDYEHFWKTFGVVLKEGLTLDYEYRERVGKLVRYESSKGEGLVSLEEYVSRMPEGQQAIYYVLGESRQAVEGSPHLEALRQRGYEVLYMTDPVDEWAADGLREFQGKPLVSAMRADLKLSESDEEKKAREEQAGALKPLLDKFQSVLKDKVREVRLSDRLTDSPCCLVIPEGATHAYLERLLRDRNANVPHVKRILEVNPKHPLIESLRALVEKEPDSARMTDWIELLHDQALLTEGSRVEDPNRFVRRVNELLTQAAGAQAGRG